MSHIIFLGEGGSQINKLNTLCLYCRSVGDAWHKPWATLDPSKTFSNDRETINNDSFCSGPEYLLNLTSVADYQFDSFRRLTNPVFIFQMNQIFDTCRPNVNKCFPFSRTCESCNCGCSPLFYCSNIANKILLLIIACLKVCFCLANYLRDNF